MSLTSLVTFIIIIIAISMMPLDFFVVYTKVLCKCGAQSNETKDHEDNVQNHFYLNVI